MAKSAKKKNKKRKDKDKKKERALAERLRRLGLPKRSAKNIADTVTNVKGQLPDPARKAINELIAKVDELRGRGSTPDDPEAAHMTGSDGNTAAKPAKKARRKAEKAAKRKTA